MANIARDLLRGAIDLHIHTGPDVVPGLVDTLKLAELARLAGQAAIVVKSHHMPTIDRALIAQSLFPEIKVFGGLTLNLPCCGGLNPEAVKTAIRMGAKIIWLPTFSAVQHMEKIKVRATGTLAIMAQGFALTPVEVLDENGAVRSELREILGLVAEADIILGMGHLSTRETKGVVAAAQAVGVRKILVNHPELWIVGMSVEDQCELAARGVMIETCVQSVWSKGAEQSPKVLADQIKAVGAESVIMATDGGLLSSPVPPQAMLWYIEQMLQHGISAEDIEKMVKVNPGRLLGL